MTADKADKAKEILQDLAQLEAGNKLREDCTFILITREDAKAALQLAIKAIEENVALKAQVETMFAVGVKTEGEIARLRVGLEEILFQVQGDVDEGSEYDRLYKIAKQTLGGKE